MTWPLKYYFPSLVSARELYIFPVSMTWQYSEKAYKGRAFNLHQSSYGLEPYAIDFCLLFSSLPAFIEIEPQPSYLSHTAYFLPFDPRLGYWIRRMHMTFVLPSDQAGKYLSSSMFLFGRFILVHSLQLPCAKGLDIKKKRTK